eukprot:14108328-Ditylum_brightwellii.AAC.1
MGGEVTDYELGLSFVTFHGSGHMVPQFRPQATLHFLEKFLKREKLAPLMPLNATLADMNIKDFHAAMNAWRDEASSAPYVNKENEERGKWTSAIN